MLRFKRWCIATRRVDPALPAKGHKSHLAHLPRFKAHGGSGGDVQPLAVRGGAVKGQAGVGYGKVAMRADL